MICLYCKGKSVKNGLYKFNVQRYKCLKCNKTFSEETIENVNSETEKRLILHLILAGCSITDIAEELEMDKKVVRKWQRIHLKNVKILLPVKPLLTTHTLVTMYRGIENSRIPKLNISQNQGRR